MTTYSAVSAATTNATVVKATPGRLFRIWASNNNAAARYLKIYAKATAPVVASDTPVLRYMIPAGGTISPQCDYYFANGLGYVMVTGAIDTDGNAVAANEILVNIDYE